MAFLDWLKRLPPPGMLAAMYFIFIALGGLVLKLPFANTGDVGWGDAFFTATSAVTVTGLVVVDTGTAFTLFGQGVLMVLMQLGGLGLMTFAVLLLSALGITVGMPQRMILREDLNQTSLGNLTTLTRIVFGVALVAEIIGGTLLSFVFVPDLGWGAGLWSAAFHSVSAFNNAGFALYPDSLSTWVDHPIVTIVVPLLFIIGGLGFVVLADIFAKRCWRRLSLHSKLMISGTIVLILVAWVMFALLEWSNPRTLGSLEGIGAKLQASFFQAVTPRTAGFNTLDTAGMHDATALMTIALMVIGGGSTSTAGGIKVTTAIVLILGTIAFFRRSQNLNAFGRRIGTSEMQKVLALATLSTAVIFIGIFLLTLNNDTYFLSMVFEAASAFGTVGLSMGATGTLDGMGRVVIMIIMFVGRVGPLALGFFLATQSAPRVRYPPGQIYLG
ncbi:trk system potassium uptake protein TrkH [Palleronia aestuarii]|uniref:Trk system potassium uptake protein TrkH n=1 Tax=Palleronia aestuarii TaxID=568105 RepID=A0A2W7MVH3_9RHOB|nr:potassium transporter TrkG [Palleronia aestuarii]PZX11830.1 trk system potassium uptake protein TrkH [Palleronia aestuarii]